jgi:hypothetical protein
MICVGCASSVCCPCVSGFCCIRILPINSTERSLSCLHVVGEIDGAVCRRGSVIVAFPCAHRLRSRVRAPLTSGLQDSRRALIISRLAQVISERKVQGGLRRVLQTQAKRLQWLAERRYEALGGAASVEKEGDEDA